ncbi:hypothetical protein SBOR_4662 [Sclerotinia borealis F-4128]|uniref:Uncharacterized protein n=1 Tax=Sclerotinia borealis (strain F-4128) TaxID=1432307 RepID=W9CG83_SCLBF|nr:hypothetical protein SBOR_4662 [Sclerotinia borealis F-4128]
MEHLVGPQPKPQDKDDDGDEMGEEERVEDLLVVDDVISEELVWREDLVDLFLDEEEDDKVEEVAGLVVVNDIVREELVEAFLSAEEEEEEKEEVEEEDEIFAGVVVNGFCTLAIVIPNIDT